MCYFFSQTALVLLPLGVLEGNSEQAVAEVRGRTPGKLRIQGEVKSTSRTDKISTYLFDGERCTKEREPIEEKHFRSC